MFWILPMIALRANVDYARIYSRGLEVCEPVFVVGQQYHRDRANEMHNAMRRAIDL